MIDKSLLCISRQWHGGPVSLDLCDYRTAQSLRCREVSAAIMDGGDHAVATRIGVISCIRESVTDHLLSVNCLKAGSDNAIDQRAFLHALEGASSSAGSSSSSDRSPAIIID